MQGKLGNKSTLNMKICEPATSSFRDLFLSFCSLSAFLVGFYKLTYYLLKSVEILSASAVGIAVFVMLFNLGMIMVLNLLYLVCYYFDKSYFHRFKVNDLPWPWEENYDKFKQDLVKILKLYVRFISVFKHLWYKNKILMFL